MGYEVDFLPVGEGERSGDAIALRFGNLLGSRSEQIVAIIDGGFQKDGEALVEHVQHHYGTDRIDLVVSTHPDQDHASGLAVVLQKLSVDRLWMHQPWNHTDGIERLFQSPRVTDASVRRALEKTLDDAHTLQELALQQGTEIEEPFTGLWDPTNTLCVLGPTQDLYEALLPDFDGTPEPLASMAEVLALYAGNETGRPPSREWWDNETLGDDGKTSAENNTSVVLLADLDPESRWLFTGDAGICALSAVANTLDATPGLGAACFHVIQIPHHGSRRNVGPTILDRFLGPRRRQGDLSGKRAYVSAAAGAAPKHPSRRVTNAFLRRGASVYGTHMTGGKVWHGHNAPDRGWAIVQQVPFYAEVGE